MSRGRKKGRERKKQREIKIKGRNRKTEKR